MATNPGSLGGAARGPGLQFFEWAVLAQVLNAILTPGLENIQRFAWNADPSNPLTPEQAADAVVRNFLDRAKATQQAREGGVDGPLFDTLVHLAGDAPGPEQLAEALRRHLIQATGKGPDSTSFEQGIAEGRLADKWTDTIKGLAQIWPTPTDALEALLKGQVTQDEAQRLYETFGGNPDYFLLLYHTQGESPTPVEAARMARRGVIPWDGTGPDATSFAQAFLEGRWKNKWSDAFRTFSEYFPPPRSTVAMLRNGSITEAVARDWLTREGAPADVADAYIRDATRTKVSKAHELSLTAIQELYADGLVSEAEGLQLLEHLGYSAADAELEIKLQQYRVSKSQLNSAVNRVRSLYVARKITRKAAEQALRDLHLQDGQIKDLVDVWEVDNQALVRVPSEAQIAGAFAYDIIDQPTAMSMLEAQGYSPYDAWLVLSVRKHEALPNPPART